MEKGSPEGYYAETSDEALAQVRPSAPGSATTALLKAS
jgi:hypothetical protein